MLYVRSKVAILQKRHHRGKTVVDVAEIYALVCDVTVKLEKFTHLHRLPIDGTTFLKIDVFNQK